MDLIRLLLALLSFLGTTALFGQDFTQTVRGTLVDFDTKTPIISAKVMIITSSPIQGDISTEEGEFKIEQVPVGRVTLKVTAYGYQEMILPNLLLESGKEKLLNLEMQSDIQVVDAVRIKSQTDKSESINKMATVSAKTFTVEETNRYAGSINDPARMVQGFAGVVGDAEGDNDIVVRGNSSRGILWRLEGIDIPNPNHFGNTGSTGGPVNMLNGSMLANSDFFSGAFAPEYGNALSGVFDVKFRRGNNEKREYSFSAGVIGLDGSLEGPLKKGYRGSYLINYRYSSIALLDAAGILDFGGIPKYQDASFNFKLPTKKFGNFSIVGLGGVSSIFERDIDDSTDYEYGNYDLKARMGVAAIKHSYILNSKMYIKSYVSASTASNGGEGMERDSNDVLYTEENERFTESNIKVQTILNYQYNRKNTFQLGGTYTHLMYDFLYEEDEFNSGTLKPLIKSKGSGDMVQSFMSWKHRFTNELSVVTGVHYTHLLLNNNFAIEPRAGLTWQQSTMNTFSAGFGLHSRVESLATYRYNFLQDDGTYSFPNKELDFAKSAHYVVGFGRRLTENLRLKTELYYQYLYNLPVENDVTSSLSLSNFNGGIPDFEMVNKGTGTNYGIELTLERFFAKNYYYLFTTSLYKSQYTALDGVQRDSRFNGNYVFNFLGGKEFKFGKGRNKTFGVNTKLALIGGNRYTPLDLDASIASGFGVYQTDKPFSAKADDIFIANLGVTYRVDKEKVSHSFKIDIQNITNNKARVNPYFNENTNSVVYSTQLSFIPNIIYTIKF